jgi:hypothetical protein
MMSEHLTGVIFVFDAVTPSSPIILGMLIKTTYPNYGIRNPI